MASFQQLRATLVLSRYSLLATLRSPTYIVSSVLFPITFIVVFGSMKGGLPTEKLAVDKSCDTTNAVFKALERVPGIVLVRNISEDSLTDALIKGKVTAILNITKAQRGFAVDLKGSEATKEGLGYLRTLVDQAIRALNQMVYPYSPSIASVKVTEIPGQTHREIDFILPGQLGFSLLMAGVFGSSFLLFNLRQGLVLKRLRATPIQRRTIIGAEMLSRLIFHILSFVIMVVLGCLAFRFTLVNGFWTFLEMLVFSLFGLGIFMGIGFVISGVLQNESSIAPVANTVVLPQILLCGLFFPITNYVVWLQKVCDILPLTFFVDGLRKIAFDGQHIWQLPHQLIGLLIWNVVILTWSVKAFKWE